MAKSKNGGSRAYISGRIGADVYSVGKNGKGERQQVVRSLAESVANPRTSSQMFGRMIMSTVMQAVSALKPIIDHSFDGLPTGQPSISEFIRRNYALVKADAIAHPSSGNYFGLSKFQEKGAKKGQYQVAAGSAQVPAGVSSASSGIVITLTEATLTVGGLKSLLGLTADGYLTFVGIFSDLGAAFFRVKLSTTLADETAITADNVASLFSIEGNVIPTVNLNGQRISVALQSEDADSSNGIIVSDKVDGAWIHNNAALSGYEDVEFASDVALPTYPTGSEMFLNGGDL